MKRRCLVTVGKSKFSEPDDNWKEKMLDCRHSPIRYLTFSFFLHDIPYWLSVELCRHHEGIEKFVRSQRDDRNSGDVPRSEKPQGALVDMIVDVNADALITIMGKRLCGCATREMQDLMWRMREEVVMSNPEFETYLVPNCMQRNGRCSEAFSPCGRTADFFEKVGL